MTKIYDYLKYTMWRPKRKDAERTDNMRIAIVEDDERDMQNLRDAVEGYTSEHKMSVEIETFSSGEDFLESFGPGKYTLVFFDNYIGNGLGINIASKAREQDEDVAFVFVSMSPEFAIPSFGVRALHYLIKPATPEGIAQVFQRLPKTAEPPENSVVELSFDYQPVLLPVRSVRYIESSNKSCIIHAEEEIIVSMQMDKVMEAFPPGVMIRTHKSYAVRLSAIKSMRSGEFILNDGSTIPIGRTHQSDCKSAFIEYLASRGGNNPQKASQPEDGRK